MKRIDKIEKISIIICFILLIIGVFLVPSVNANMNTGKLIINEVMLVNNNTIQDKDGKFNDYIELFNGNDYDINLEGYYLSDNMKDTRKWIFPEVTIKANDYLVIFASSKDYKEDELHTNFKLDSDGETIALSDNTSKVISKIYVRKTLKDTSYGFNGDKYVYYYNGTPGKENTGDYSEEAILELNSNYKLAITEYMSNNISYLASNNKYYGLIEIHNYDNKDINLKGFYLTDKEDNITKYTFPDITIKKDEYLVIYASGLNEIIDKEVHTNFKLNGNDGVIVLSSPNKAIISRVNMQNLDTNASLGIYKDKWHVYYKPSIGKENTNDYGSKNILSDIIINEVSIYPSEAIELYNDSDYDIDLTGYSLEDKSNTVYNFKNKTIKSKGFLVVYRSSFGFGINSVNEIITLKKDGQVVDTFKVNKLVGNISVGMTGNDKYYYKTITLGYSNNAKEKYIGFSEVPVFNIDGGYIDKNSEITLTTTDGSEIYYTINGTFPTKNSIKYTKPIKLSKTTVIKAISYKDGYIESDVISRTFVIGRKHSIAFVSVSTNNMNFYQEYHTTSEQKASFEFYDEKGEYGTSFTADIKTSGKSSSMLPQKSIAVYLRKKYGLSSVNYPFFENLNYHNFSSILLRNGGTDPSKVHIKDAILTQIIKGEMDIDMQDYRPIVVYLNGNYYGLYSLREKVNADYLESKFGVDKDNVDLIKKKTVIKGSMKDFNSLKSYINSHDVTKSDVYQYIESKIDIQELINYYLVQCFFDNSDLFKRNVGLWKEGDGKWRWIIYDLDFAYITYETKPVLYLNQNPYYDSSLDIIVRLYKNKDFKDLYLKTLAKFIKTTFKPDRVDKIFNKLVSEVEDEMTYHIKRWGSNYTYVYNWDNIPSMSSWKNNLNVLKKQIKTRYNDIVNNLQSGFKLSDSEYKKYFGDI